MSYGHAAALAALPPCADCPTRPAWTRSDIDGRPLCPSCNLTEQRGA